MYTKPILFNQCISMNAFKRKNLLIGFGLSLLLLTVSSLASYLSIRSLLESQTRVTHTNLVIARLERLISVMKDAETGQRGFLLTGEPEFLDPYHGARTQSESLIAAISELTAGYPEQQENIASLSAAVAKRFSILDSLIAGEGQERVVSVDDLRRGKAAMEEIRALVNLMQEHEQTLLASRTGNLGRFAAVTPLLIILAFILALIVAIVSFLRINSDLRNREKLQNELEQKEEDMRLRIQMIENIASQISAGDYSARVTDEEKDHLGNLALSLNAMAGSLEKSFNELADKEWLQTGIAALSDEMIDEKDIPTLTQNVLRMVAEYSNSQSGAFYLLNAENTLELQSGYALSGKSSGKVLRLGEGLAGQCAMSSRIMEHTGLSPEDYTVSFTAGNVKPRSVIAIPIFFYRRLKGVIELASMKTYSVSEKLYLEAASHNIGIAVNTAQNKEKLEELLEETQSQSEELQAQHTELENVNAELETQAEKLQASEEELKVQQEELQQANSELEERTRLLEEKNQLIARHNKDIEQKAEQLELSTKYKSEFLANMSHELRTPLNSILLLSRLLGENNEKNLSESEIEYARVIHHSGQGLLSLINEILDLSKIESGKMELEFVTVRVDDVLSNMKALFDPVAKEKNLGLKFETDAGAAAVLETDPLRLEQVLKNFLSNALKFTEQGSVTLRASGREGAITFSVADTGIGISREKQALIFEAFQQADGSTRRKFGGTGLGLSISRELAKLLGGEISVTSEPGRGSEFSLTIPVKRSTVPPVIQPGVVEKAEERPAETTAERAPEKAAAGRPARYVAPTIPAEVPDDRASVMADDKVILIVEDDTAFAKTLLDYTRQQGYKGIVTVRGDQALELAKQFKPRGILLDVQLPVRDGWEVMEELKGSPETRHIPVHMMSVYEFRKKSLLKGAVDFISKPVAFEQMPEMFRKIEQVLSGNPRKVLIVEDNPKHAKALSWFLESYNVISEVKSNIGEGIQALNKEDVRIVILDMGIPDQKSYDTLEEVKQTPGLENIPIIIFTGKSISRNDELHIKHYADSIIIKTAHSYQRLLDEVSLFLHLVDEQSRKERSTKQARSGQMNEVLKDSKVLVVDDDVRNIFSLTRILEAYQTKVFSAIDGKEALKQLENDPGIDLVLMDMMMPEMDGYEAIARIRKDQRFRSLPIIAVTAKAMSGDREKCISAGASDYVTKPVDTDQLLSLLRVWLYE